MVFISLNDLNVWTSHAVCIEEVRLLTCIGSSF